MTAVVFAITIKLHSPAKSADFEHFMTAEFFRRTEIAGLRALGQQPRNVLLREHGADESTEYLWQSRLDFPPGNLQSAINLYGVDHWLAPIQPFGTTAPVVLWEVKAERPFPDDENRNTADTSDN